MDRITDHRRNKRKPILWIVGTDKVLSGWRNGPDKSYVAYPVYSQVGRSYLMGWLVRNKHDLIRLRTNLHLPKATGNKHLSIYDNPLEDVSNE